MPLPDFKVFSEKFAQLESLITALPKAIPLAMKDDKIYQVFDRIPVSADPSKGWEIFNGRMDAIFGHELRDEKGRLLHVKRGPLGMDMILKYVKDSMDAGNLLWDLAAIKIDRLVEELKILKYVLHLLLKSCIQWKIWIGILDLLTLSSLPLTNPKLMRNPNLLAQRQKGPNLPKPMLKKRMRTTGLQSGHAQSLLHHLKFIVMMERKLYLTQNREQHW